MMAAFVEMIVIVSISVSLPTLAMAMWHGWKFELHRSEQDMTRLDEGTPVDEGTPPWN